MKFTLITGASSGIGAMYARQSALAGQNLILVSNQAEQLEQVAAEGRSLCDVVVKCIDIDLSAADAAEQIYNRAKEWGEVDILISNAGVLHFGKFLSTTDSYIDFITALHYTPPMKLCRLFGLDMAAKGEGKILGGMIPKVRGGIEAIDSGVNTVHIIDGRIPHCLLLEIFTDSGIGTMITR